MLYMSDYCVQLKDGDHKIFPTTLAHCVYDEEGNDLLSLLERLSDNSSVTINELIGEVKKESPNTNIYRRLIALATESKLTVYYTTETAPSTVEVGSLWYNRTEDTVSQFYSGSWTTIEDRNLLDAIKAMNPEYSLGTLDIYVQDREPSDPDEGDVLINGNGIKQYVSDTWSDTTDIRLGGSNIVRYSRDYNPTTYTKWIDSRGATSTNIPVEIEEDKGLSVQRIHGAHVSVSQALKFKPASYYCISAYMKSSDPDNLATIRATVDLSQCSIETSNFNVDEPLTTEYQRYCFVIRTFSTCSYMDCRFESKISNPYDIYGLQIEEGLEYTEWNLNQYDIVETLIRLSTSHEYASNIYYCTEAEVTTPSDHDICYDRGDSKVYLYEDDAWIDITDKDLVSSLEYLDIESYSNLGMYVQSSEPTATINGSIWIDRDDNNQMYRWDASHNLWVVVDTSVVANSINKIVQSLSETKTLSGILDGVATRVEETSTLVSEITPEHIISVISNSNIYKDVNGKTLMERMESAESNTTAEHIIDTVTQSTKYSEDLSGKVSTSDFNNLANSVTTTYYGSEEPSNPVMGDMWVRNDSDINRGLWRYDGGNWINLNDDVLYASMLVAQTATDKANSGIASVDVEYYKSTSSTALVGGSWSTESPAWENGTYIWSRTTTTNGAGQTSQTSPICITGNTGAQGIPGINGINGANGINGTNGTSSYFHIKYSNVSNPTSSSQMSEVPDIYIGTYVDTVSNDSNDPSYYTWYKIQGIDGEQGIPGTNGTDGRTSYLHIAYANNSIGTDGFSTSDSANKLYIGQYTDFNVDDSTDPSMYLWTKIKGEQGERGVQGLQGLQGLQGEQGIPGTNGTNGINGQDGISSYFHIKYSSVASPTSSQMSETPDEYIGTYVDDTSADSNNPSDYTWYRFKGLDGTNGIPGTNGVDGRTSYLHIAYATNSNGTSGFSVSVATDKTYIGQYTDFVEADSTNPSDYNWTKIKGDNGITYYTWVKYATDNLGSNMSDDPTDKSYIGIAHNKTSSTESTNAADYTWSLFKGSDGTDGTSVTILGSYNTLSELTSAHPTGLVGDSYIIDGSLYVWSSEDDAWTNVGQIRGPQGTPGTNGVNSYLHIKYSNDNGITFTSNNGEDVGTYIGQYVDTSIADSNNPSDYTWARIKGDKGDTGLQGLQGDKGDQGIPGTNGTNGTSSYFHIKYSAVANPTLASQMSEEPNDYVGTYVDTTPADSNNPSNYSWYRFKGLQGDQGDQGIPGTNGTNGVSSYLHIKYSNDGGTTFTSNSGETVGDYIGTRVDTTLQDSTTPSDYTWVKIKGEQGEQGPRGLQGLQGDKGDQGIPGINGTDGLNGTNGTSSYFHIKYSAVANPTTSSQMSETPNEYIGTYVNTTSTDSNNPSDYTWYRFKGLQGDQGDQGIPGSNGADGVSSYLHIKYSNDNGSTFTSNSGETVGDYIGTLVNSTVNDSTTPSDYTWVKIKGEQGEQGPRGLQGLQGEQGTQGIQGIPGTNGTNGTSSYFHIKYSSEANPTLESQMTEVPSEYIGTYVDIVSTDSNDPSKYTWYRFKGLQGDQGIQGIPGTDGTNGISSYLHIKYSNDGGTSFTTNTGEDIGTYIGTLVDTTLSDSLTPSDYTWAKIKGEDGANGTNGADGLGISLINEEYYLSNSNTSQSGGSWVTTLPTWELGKHIWTRSKITYTDDSVSYTDPVYAEDINSNNLLTYCTTAETYIKETEPTSSDATAKGTTLTNGDLWLKQDSINGNALYRYIDSAWVLLDVSSSITSRVTIKYAELKRLSDSIELKATREEYFDVNGNVKTGLNCTSTESSVKVTPDDVNIYTKQFNVQIPSEDDSDGAQELLINKTGVNTTFMTTEDIECPTIYKKYKGTNVFSSVTDFTDIMFNLNNKILDDNIIINITAGSTIDRSLDLRGITGSGSITVNGNGGDSSVTEGSYITAGVNIIGCDVRVTFNYVFSNFNEERSLYVYYNNCTTSSTFYRTITKEFTATMTDTLRNNVLLNRPDCFYQGFTNNKLYGLIYFSGLNYESIPQASTVISATMTVQRQANYGGTTTVPMTAYASVYGTSLSIDESISPSTGRISFGSKAYMDVTQFIDHLRSNSTQNCICIYNGESSAVPGKDYSTNYAKFYGCGTTGVPTLSVTYRESVQESSGSTFTSDKSQIRSALGLLNAVYPVGSVYMSVNDVNPSSFIGGTWESIQDQFLVGAGNLYSTGSTGGSSTHNHEAPSIVNASNKALGINYGYGSTTKSVSGTTRYLGASGSTSGEFSAYVPNTSSSSNLPPYMAVYMWKRTA